MKWFLGYCWLIRSVALLTCLTAAMPAFAEDDKEDNPSIEFTIEKHGNISSIFASNPFAFPVTVTFELSEDSENVRMSPREPATIVLPPNARRRTVTMKPIRRNERWHYNYMHYCKYGDARKGHDPEAVYRLPYAKGESYRVGQGPFGDFSHQDEVAYDFGLPEGTPIHAARGGVVVRVVDHFTKAGVSEAFKDRGNLIYILHEDGTIANYHHLMPEGARVELGDKVETGQLIGLSGNTGYSQGPHLHFELFRPIDGKAYSKDPIRFHTAEGTVDELEKDRSYVNPED